MSRLSTILVLLCVSVPSFMINLDANIVAVSLPSIAHSLGASFADVEWVISAYTLTFASFVLPAGTLADRFGRKRILLIGLFLFTAASLVCGAAPNALTLNLARAVQGVGAACQLSAALAILSFEFRGAARAKAFAFWGTVIGIAITVGPICGGVITQAVGWEWAFYINIPIGLIMMITTMLAVNDSRDPDANRLDISGLVTFSGALLCATYALITGNKHGWSSHSVVLAFIAAVILAIVFVMVEMKQKRPMLDMSFFRHATYVGATLATFASAVCNLTMLTFLPLYFQSALGSPPRTAGLMMLPMALPMFIVPRVVSAYLSHRFSGRSLVSIGLLLGAVGLLSLGYGAATQDYMTMLPGLVVVGMGAGFLNGEIAKVSMSVIPRERAGMAAGIGGTVRFSGIVLGFAALGAILFEIILHDASSLTPDARPLVQQLMSGAHVDGLPSEAMTMVAQGYSSIFYLVGALAVATTLAAWFLINSKDTAPVPRAPAQPPLPTD